MDQKNAQNLEHEETETEEKMSGKVKIIIVLSLTLVLAIGSGFGIYFVWQRANYISTDNARVTTTLIAIAPPVPGRLERFTAYEGRRVVENEVIGWVEGAEAFRSPITGIVIHTNAVQDQAVTPAEAIAVIADTADVHILANIEETNIARIRSGQAVTVTIDPFGSRRFSGYVREVAHVTSAELTGSALFFNTGGTFTRVTHLIPVKINITDDVDLASLIGVNARVRILLRDPPAETRALTAVTSPQTVAPEHGIADTRISVRGTVESTLTRRVYSTLGFVVQRVYVEAGDTVEEGQVLGLLDSTDLDIQLLNAQAALQVSEISVATAQHNLGIARTLYGVLAISSNELRQAEFAYQSSLALRQQAFAQVRGVEAAIERSVLTSPIRGTVTAVIAQEGSIGSGLMFIVEDTENLRVMTSFREHDLNMVRTGMEVAIISDAAFGGITLDQAGSLGYSGIISRINPAATLSLPIAEFEAEVLVTSQDTSLRIGMGTRLDITVR